MSTISLTAPGGGDRAALWMISLSGSFAVHVALAAGLAAVLTLVPAPERQTRISIETVQTREAELVSVPEQLVAPPQAPEPALAQTPEQQVLEASVPEAVRPTEPALAEEVSPRQPEERLAEDVLAQAVASETQAESVAADDTVLAAEPVPENVMEAGEPDAPAAVPQDAAEAATEVAAGEAEALDSAGLATQAAPATAAQVDQSIAAGPGPAATLAAQQAALAAKEGQSPGLAAETRPGAAEMLDAPAMAAGGAVSPLAQSLEPEALAQQASPELLAAQETLPAAAEAPVPQVANATEAGGLALTSVAGGEPAGDGPAPGLARPAEPSTIAQGTGGAVLATETAPTEVAAPADTARPAATVAVSQQAGAQEISVVPAGPVPPVAGAGGSPQLAAGAATPQVASATPPAPLAIAAPAGIPVQTSGISIAAPPVEAAVAALVLTVPGTAVAGPPALAASETVAAPASAIAVSGGPALPVSPGASADTVAPGAAAEVVTTAQANAVATEADGVPPAVALPAGQASAPAPAVQVAAQTAVPGQASAVMAPAAEPAGPLGAGTLTATTQVSAASEVAPTTLAVSVGPMQQAAVTPAQPVGVATSPPPVGVARVLSAAPAAGQGPVIGPDAGAGPLIASGDGGLTLVGGTGTGGGDGSGALTSSAPLELVAVPLGAGVSIVGTEVEVASVAPTEATPSTAGPGGDASQGQPVASQKLTWDGLVTYVSAFAASQECFAVVPTVQEGGVGFFAYGADVAVNDAFQRDFSRTFGIDLPAGSMQANTITAEQCVALDFLRTLPANSFKPVIRIDAAGGMVADGTNLSGSVLGMGGLPTRLFIVDDRGRVQTADDYVLTSSQSEVTFSAPVHLTDGGEAMQQLVIAVASAQPLRAFADMAAQLDSREGADAAEFFARLKAEMSGMDARYAIAPFRVMVRY